VAATVTPIQDARRAAAREAIARAVADVLAAARTARAAVEERLRAQSPGRRRIARAVERLEAAVQRAMVGDDRRTAEERRALAEGIAAARAVRRELARTASALRRAARRRDRTILERIATAPGEVAADVADTLARTLDSAGERIERGVTSVATSAVDAWGRVVPTIGLGGIALVIAGAWLFFGGRK
jgi:hypothetical protein